MQTLKYTEDHASQIPALKMLINMGWEYIILSQALEMRRKRTHQIPNPKKGLMQKLLTGEIRVKDMIK